MEITFIQPLTFTVKDLTSVMNLIWEIPLNETLHCTIFLYLLPFYDPLMSFNSFCVNNRSEKLKIILRIKCLTNVFHNSLEVCQKRV